MEPIAALALVLALALALLYVPSLAGEFFLPRYALLPLEGLVGLVLCVALLRTGLRVPAALGLAFAGWALLSTVWSPDPATALRGEWLWGDGLVFAVALVGMWAIGASAGERGRQLVEDALVVGAVVNAGVAIIETLVNLGSIDLGPFDGRAVGLWGNPVWLGAFLVGGLWIVCSRCPRSMVAWGVVAALLAAGIQVSGSRSALVVAAGVVAVVVWRHKWRTGGLVAAWVVVGLLIGLACTAATHQSSATSRTTADDAGGLSARVENWKGAAHALGDRPLLGSGPGRYVAAVGPYRTVKLAAERGPERLLYDAHNIVVEYAVTTGIPGLLLLLAFLFVALKRAGPSSALGGFGLAVLAVHLVEPQNPGLTVLVTLALGAGAAGSAVRPPPRWRPALLSAAAVGVVIAAVLIVGGWQWEQSIKDNSVSTARSARGMLPHWADVDAQVALALQTNAAPGGKGALAAMRASERWAAQATTDDPGNESAWATLGSYQGLLGQLSGAQSDFERALRLNPTSVQAMDGLGEVAALEKNLGEARTWWNRSLALQPDPQLTEELQQLRG